MDLVNQPFTEKGKKTLNALVDASRKNFYSKGYYKTTVKDITKDAGVSVGAFYLYFEDKLSVYKYLVTTYGKFIRNHISKHIEASPTRREAERAGLIAYIDLVRENPDIYNIVWEALYIDKEIFMDYYLEFSQSYSRQLEKSKESLEKKLKELATRKDDTVNFESLGIDGLFVDEAHNFKALSYYTKLNVAGGVQQAFFFKGFYCFYSFVNFLAHFQHHRFKTHSCQHKGCKDTCRTKPADNRWGHHLLFTCCKGDFRFFLY